jgi:hypothetical protein
VTPHRRRANFGQTQLGPPGLQKGELLDQVHALPLNIITPRKSKFVENFKSFINR